MFLDSKICNMEAILISMLSWLVINLITRLAWKLKVSKTYVSVLLSILVWVIVYCFQILIKKYPVQWEQVMWFVAWAYATSQVVYNLYKKFVENKENNVDKEKEEAK